MAKCGNCQGHHDNAAQVRSCYGNSGKFNTTVELPAPDPVAERLAEKAEFAEREAAQERAAYEAKMRRDDELVAAARRNVAVANAASPRQTDYIKSLCEERDITVLEPTFLAVANKVFAGEPVGKESASNLIDRLMRAPRQATTNAAADRRHSADVPEGVHFLDGTYFKVQVAKQGSGRKYSKTASIVNGKIQWDYTPGAIRNLSEATVLTAEQASEFGRLYGICIYCSRDLTDERSIAVGYGPVCASNYDLPWGEIAEGEDAQPTFGSRREFRDQFVSQHD